MDNLIGRRFMIDQTEYAVVDVHNMSGESLVYAEPSMPLDAAEVAEEGARVAIRSVDIAPLLDASTTAAINVA